MHRSRLRHSSWFLAPNLQLALCTTPVLFLNDLPARGGAPEIDAHIYLDNWQSLKHLSVRKEEWEDIAGQLLVGNKTDPQDPHSKPKTPKQEKKIDEKSLNN